MDALNSMQNFLRGRPKTFKSVENAIEWRYTVLDILLKILFSDSCLKNLIDPVMYQIYDCHSINFAQI